MCTSPKTLSDTLIKIDEVKLLDMLSGLASGLTSAEGGHTAKGHHLCHTASNPPGHFLQQRKHEALHGTLRTLDQW